MKNSFRVAPLKWHQVPTKIYALDLLLLGTAVAIAMHTHSEWRKEQARERNFLMERSTPTLPEPRDLASFAPITAADYRDTINKLLFSNDRNPTVIVELPPPLPAKPMPPLPKVFGVLDVGDGTVAILAITPEGEQREYGEGDEVGAFKLISLGDDRITLSWEGQTIIERIQKPLDSVIPPDVYAKLEPNHPEEQTWPTQTRAVRVPIQVAVQERQLEGAIQGR